MTAIPLKNIKVCISKEGKKGAGNVRSNLAGNIFFPSPLNRKLLTLIRWRIPQDLVIRISLSTYSTPNENPHNGCCTFASYIPFDEERERSEDYIPLKKDSPVFRVPLFVSIHPQSSSVSLLLRPLVSVWVLHLPACDALFLALPSRHPIIIPS